MYLICISEQFLSTLKNLRGSNECVFFHTRSQNWPYILIHVSSIDQIFAYLTIWLIDNIFYYIYHNIYWLHLQWFSTPKCALHLQRKLYPSMVQIKSRSITLPLHLCTTPWPQEKRNVWWSLSVPSQMKR